MKAIAFNLKSTKPETSCIGNQDCFASPIRNPQSAIRNRIFRNPQFNDSGFSLIEVLIAFLLLIILIGPLLSFMRAGQISRSTSLRLTDIEQNARSAMISIGRDLQNAGYNFTSQVPLENSTIITTLLGVPTGASNFLSPIIPGNNINLVRTVNSTGTTVTNATDQITFVFVDQSFNNGLPLSGNVPNSGNKFTALASFTGLFPRDFVVLSQGARFAIGCIGSINNNTVAFDNDPYGVNQLTNNKAPLALLGAEPQKQGSVGLYKFLLITYFVDGNGNLIRREQLPPPHTAQGGNNAINPATLTPNSNTYACAGTCFIDNIIATGVEDLQLTYYLADPNSLGVTGPIDDPGFYGRTANLGTAPEYRLLDIRQVNVSIKVRAADRDTKLKDPYNKRQGYLYRFSLEATYNTRNFYGSDFRQN